MKKKVAIILAGAMLLTCLTGCSERVTAESLIDNAYDTEYLAYHAESNIKMEVVNSGQEMEATVLVDIEYENSPYVFRAEGTIETETEVDAYDYNATDCTEINYYGVLDDDIETGYTYDSETKEWYVEEDEVVYETYIPMLSADMFDELELEEKNDGYEVTGIIKDEKAMQFVFDSSTYIILDALDDYEMKATLLFNEDKELDTYEIEIIVDDDEFYEVEGLGEAAISKFVITIDFKSFEGNKVEVPSKVEKNAIAKDESADAKEEIVEEETTETEEISLGTITETTYENEYLNIGWSLISSDWKMLSREELDSVYNSTLDLVGEDYAEVLENATVFYDMMAADYSSMNNINIVVENLGSYANVYSEEMYAEYCLSSVQAFYEQMGYTDISISNSTMEFMGETHACMITQYNDGSAMKHQLQGYVKVGTHMVVITATSCDSEEACYSCFEGFYRLSNEGAN